jgi:GNAT superfamily N-acetyltransferase
MYLEDIIVTESMRGKGIGKLLFEALIKESKEKEFNGMAWQVLDWNESAMRFYKKFKGVQFDESWVNGSITA